MKIGIISDTHDNVKNILKAVEYLNKQQVDLIYHAGDWVAPFVFEFLFWEAKPEAPVKGVFGNNEGDRFRTLQRINKHKLPIKLEAYTLKDEIDGKKVILYHGQDSQITESLINDKQYDLVVTGHTHDPLVKASGERLHVNPGAVCDASNSKLTTPTLAVYDTKLNQAKIVEFLKEV